MLSVVVLTKNEEATLKGCLASVSFADDVVIFDSFSDDATCQIARNAGARVVKHRFQDYGSQRQAALELPGLKHSWVLMLDADEKVDDELARELVGRPWDRSPHAAFRVRRKDMFLGSWIRRSSLYPSWFVRLLRRDQVSYGPRPVHEYPEVNGSVGRLHGHLVHDSFSKGLDAWWLKHIAYARMEAEAQARVLDEHLSLWPALGDLVDPVERRRWLKRLSIHMPARPELRFLYGYLLRGGALDGVAGLHYCRLLRAYEHLIVLHLDEARKRRG